MGDGSLLPYLLLLALFFAAACFSSAETAYSTVNKVKIKAKAEAGNDRAVKAGYIINHFEKALSTILVGTNISTIAISTIVTAIVTGLWGAKWVSLSTAVVTIVVLLFAEMIPKSFAKAKNEEFSLAAAPAMKALMTLLTPVTFVFSKFADLMSRIFVGKEEPTVTEDELYDIIEDIKDSGSIPEGKLISSALEFSDITAGDIFTSRVDVVAIDQNASCAEILETIKNCNHSRLPVYDGDIDNLIGVLQIRKYLKAYLKQGDAVDLKSLIDPIHFVPRSVEIQDLLNDMSHRKTNIAAVTDDYGGTLGIVTVEDILEELVGEIFDEDDVIGEDFAVVDERTFDVAGDMGVINAFDMIGYEDYDSDETGHGSLSSWATEQFGRIPRQGASFVYRGVNVCALKVSRQRIVKLRLTLLPEAEREEAEHE